jgi:glyoxylase-like metal-dependent hydrolase (beta-lactamase superfamily II)
MNPPALDGLQVWDRGWLSSTQVLVHGRAGEHGALLFDAAHGLHAAQTLALLRHGLASEPLRAVVNTHLHSDHCGGNQAIAEEFKAEIWIPPGQAQAVHAWQGMSHQQTGQTLPRFTPHRVLDERPIVAGGRAWQPLPAPGHDPHARMFFDGRVLVAGDALWERGFGVVFPELWGEDAFGAALQVLVPGHGPACEDVPAALAQARARLQAWCADPRSHARYAAKVLIKYHLMEQRRVERPDLLDWLEGLPLLQTLWQRLDLPTAPSLRDWGGQLVEQLVKQGALRMDGAALLDN